MRYRRAMQSIVWILTSEHRRAVFHMNNLGIRETGIPVKPGRAPLGAIAIAGPDWVRQIRGYHWSDGDWVLADSTDEDLPEKLFQLQLAGAPANPPLRWL